MTPKESHMPDEYSASEFGRAVERIELDIREIKTDVKQQGQNFVTRLEFDAWRQGIGREVGDLKAATSSVQDAVTTGLNALRAEWATDFAALRTEVRSSTPQWWVIAALGVSALGLVITILLALNNGG
jgi:hypothetical protein